MTRRTCPVCDTATALTFCCGIDLTERRRHFRMTRVLITRVHALASQKGLDDDTYRLRLSAVGVTTCKALDLEAFRTFMRGLASLPDCPRWRASHPARRSLATLPAIATPGAPDEDSHGGTMECGMSAGDARAVHAAQRGDAGNQNTESSSHLGSPAHGGDRGVAAGVFHAGCAGGSAE